MGKKLQEGFTLIEFLVMMMVAAIALGIGVPALQNMVASSRMSEAANDMVRSLHAARAEASTRARTVTVCASGSWDAGLPACEAGARLLDGWIVFADADADASVDPGEPVLQTHGPVADGIRRQPRSGTDGGDPAYVAFRPDGLPQDLPALPAAVRNIQMCDARGNRDTGGGVAAGRWIAISPAGRPMLVDRVARLQGESNPLGGC